MIDKFSNSNELAVIFEIHQYYYLKKDNQYYQIQRKKDLFLLMGNDAKEIKNFIEMAHLNFRQSKEILLTKAVDFYNQKHQ